MNQGVRKGSIYALFGQGTASIFIFLFQMFAGRWLGVEDYGLLNVLYSAIFIVTVIVIAGVMQGLTRYIAFFEAKDDPEGVNHSIQTSFITFLFILSFIIVISLIIKSTLLGRLFNNNHIILIQYIIGICTLSFYRFYNGILQGLRKFCIFSFGVGFKEFLIFTMMAVTVNFLSKTVQSAGLSIIISPVIVLFYILIVTRKHIPYVKLKKFDGINISIVKFIMIAGTIALMNQWVIRAGPLLLKLIGGSEGDYYAGLFSAIIMPLNLSRAIVLALLIGLFPNLTRAYSLKDDNLIRRYVYKSAGIVTLIVIIVIPVYYFFGPQIVKLLYGKEFIAYRSDTLLLSLVISSFLFGILLSKIIMARGTPIYSAISFFVGIIGLSVVLFFVKLNPMKVVEIALLVCNSLYAGVQFIFLIISRYKHSRKVSRL